MIRLPSAFALVALLSAGLAISGLPDRAAAQDITPQIAGMTPQIPEIMNGGQGEYLSPEDAKFLKSIRALADGVGDVLDVLNPAASNSGTTELVDKLVEKREALLNLSNRIGPDGEALSMRQLKRLFGVTGADKAGQVRELLAKKAAELRSSKLLTALDKLKAGERASFAANIIDPGSKILGAMSAGDYSGATLHLISGGCKFGITTYVGGAVVGTFAAGTAPISVPIVIGSAAAVGVTSYAYDAYIQPLFDALNQRLVSSNAWNEYSNTDWGDKYDDIIVGDSTVADVIKDYVSGKKSEREMRMRIESVRDVIRERNKQIAAEQAEEKEKVVTAMRSIAGKYPELVKDIDLFEQGKLEQRDALPLLRALQTEFGDTCREKANHDFVVGWLGKLGYDRLNKIPTIVNANPQEMDNAYQCMCDSYSIMGAAVGFHPAPTKNCDIGSPCKGGNWGCVYYDLPSDVDIMTRCLAKVSVSPQVDGQGNAVPGSAVSLDKFIASQAAAQRYFPSSGNATAGQEP